MINLMLNSSRVVERKLNNGNDNNERFKKHEINPLRPNNDLSQTSPCNIKGLSVREVLRIENMITQMKFY